MSKTTLSLSIGEGAARLQGADATLRQAERVLTPITRNLLMSTPRRLFVPSPEPSEKEHGIEAREPGPPSMLSCGRMSLWGKACEATLRRTLCLMLPASIREGAIEDVLHCMGCRSNADANADDNDALKAAPPWLQHARALAGPLEGPGITEDDTVWGSAALANIWESPGWIEDVVLPALGDLQHGPQASSPSSDEQADGRPDEQDHQQHPTADSLRSSVAGLRAADAAARLPWSEGRLDPEALRSGIEVVRGLVRDLEALDLEGAAAFRSGVRPPLSPPPSPSAPHHPSQSQKAYRLPESPGKGAAPSQSLLVLSGESMCRVVVQLAVMLCEERLVPCVRREAGGGGELPAPGALLTDPEAREEARKQSGLTAAASAAAGVGGTAQVVLPPAPVSIGDLTTLLEYCSRAVAARPGSVRSTPLLRKLRRALLDERGRGPNPVLPTCRSALGLFGASRASAVTPLWAAELLGALRRLTEAFGDDHACRRAAEAIGVWERKLGSVFRLDAVALSVEWGATWSVNLPPAPSSSGAGAARQPYPTRSAVLNQRSSFDVSELSSSPGPIAMRGSSQRRPGEAVSGGGPRAKSRSQAPLWPVQERSSSSRQLSSQYLTDTECSKPGDT